MQIIKTVFLAFVIIFAFSLNINAQDNSSTKPATPDGTEKPADEDEYPSNLNLEKNSHLPKDLSPINYKTVAILPFGLMNPATTEGVKIARGIEVLLEYYLDFYFHFTVTSSSFVMKALVDMELPPAPGLKEAKMLAEKLEVDYIIFGNVYLGKPDITLKGGWYDYKNKKLLNYVEQQSSVSMLLRLLNNFSRQLAYVPQLQYPRTEVEKKASENKFCKYITTFLFFVDAYMAFIRNDIKTAEENLDSAIEHEPSFMRAILFKAELTLMQYGLSDWEVYSQKVRRLITQLENFTVSHKHDFRMFWILGLLNLKSGEPSSNKAHNLFKKTFNIRKNWIAAYQDMIIETMPALMAVNQYYSNLENIYLEAKKVRKLFPNNPSAFFVLPKISYILGNTKYAAEILTRMSETFPDYINGLRLLAEIQSKKIGPAEAVTTLLNILKYQPYDYYLTYQMFLTLFDAAFKGINQDDDNKNISREEIIKANKRDFPNKRKHSFFRRIKFGFNLKHFENFDTDANDQLDKKEFLLLLANYAKGPVIRTGPKNSRDESGLSLISEEIWHYALLCYAMEGTSGPGFGDDGETLGLFINSNAKFLEKMFEAEKIYVEIADDSELYGYSINNQLSNLVILWGLADKYKGDKETAQYAAKKYLAKIDALAKDKTDLLCKNWRCNALTFEIYPNRKPSKRLAPMNLPDFDFTTE